MSINNFEEVKNYLNIENESKFVDGIFSTDKASQNWLNVGLTAYSPIGDFIVLAAKHNAVFLKRRGLARKFHIVHKLCLNRNLDDVIDFDEKNNDSINSDKLVDNAKYITAALCLVIVNSGSVSDYWTSIVIGFSDGSIEFYTEGGRILARRRFQISQSSVLSIRCKKNFDETKKKKLFSNQYGVMSDLIVVYSDFLAVVSASHLYAQLNAARSCISGMNEFEQANNFQFRHIHARIMKTTTNEVCIRDVAAVSKVNVLFDQYNALTMRASQINQEHLGSLSILTDYITIGGIVGEEPSVFLQFNSPHCLSSMINYNELANNVVSTVTSGLLRAAKGFLFSNRSESNVCDDLPRPDTETNLDVISCMRDDGGRVGLKIEPSPDGRLCAVADSTNRVLLIDNHLRCVVHVWKGAHRAQIGWILSDSIDENSPSIPLLVIYLPVRGILEIWSPESKTKIAAFSGCYFGCLLNASPSIITAFPTSSAPHISSLCCYFSLSEGGNLYQIKIPIGIPNSDTIILKQLSTLMEDWKHDESTLFVDKCVALLSKASCLDSRHKMLLHLFTNSVSNDALSTENVKRLTLAIDFCPSVWSKLVDLYQVLSDYSPSVNSDVNTLVEDDTILQRFINLEVVKSLEPFDKSVVKLNCFSQLVALFDFENLSDHQLQLKKYTPKIHRIPLTLWINSVFLMSNSELSNWCDLLTPTLILKLIFRCHYIYSARFIVSIAFSIKRVFSVINVNFTEAPIYELENCAMTPSSVTIMHLWNCYLSDNDVWNRQVKSAIGFLELQYCFLDTFGTDLLIDEVSYNDVFCFGNGRLTELVASWLVHHLPLSSITDYGLEDAELKVKIDSFCHRIQSFFPNSLCRSVMLVHLIWQHAQLWNSNRTASKHLACCIDLFNELVCHDHIFKDLGQLLWISFFSNYLHMETNQLDDFVIVQLTKFLRLLQERSDHQNDSFIRLTYDDISLIGREHLLDHLYRFSSAATAISLDMNLMLQLTIAIRAIAVFAPVELSLSSLFKPKDLSALFTRQIQNTNVVRIDGSQLDLKRFEFLSAVIDGAVSLISYAPNSQLDIVNFQSWTTDIIFLGDSWFPRDNPTFCMMVTTLYKYGFDGLGSEMIASVPDKSVLISSLLEIGMCRLASYVFLASDHDTRLALMDPQLVHMLEDFVDHEPGYLAETSLTDTANLFVQVVSLGGGNDVDDDRALKCLSAVQTFKAAISTTKVASE